MEQRVRLVELGKKYYKGIETIIGVEKAKLSYTNFANANATTDLRDPNKRLFVR
jgi:hypothetical protein